MAESKKVEFERLLEHQGWMRGLARTLVLDDATVDDVVQEAWIAALAAPPRTEESTRSWLGTVVRRLSYRTYRDRDRRQRREQSAAQPEQGPNPERGRAEHATEQLETQQRVIAAVLALPDATREVVLLRYYEELSSAEIARRLDMPAATVRTRLKRGLDELRGTLDAEFGERSRWGMALLPLAHLRPFQGSISASAGVAGRGIELSSWIGIGSWIVSTQKIAALLVVAVAVALALGIRAGMNGGMEGDEGRWAEDRSGRGGAPHATPPADVPEVAVGKGAAVAPRDEKPPVDLGIADDANEPLGLRVVGRVADLSDRPIRGARIMRDARIVREAGAVRDVRDLPSGAFDPLVTDEDGQFVFELERFTLSGSYEVTVEADRYATAFHIVSVEPGADLDVGTITLGPGAQLSGRVVDESGLPVSDVDVRVHRPDRYSALRGITDRDGRFRFSGVPVGYIEVRAFDQQSESKRETVVVKAEEETDVELTLRPRDTTNLCRGIVLGPDGEPFPNASVTASSDFGITGSSCASDGTFSFAAKPGAAITLRASGRLSEERFGGGLEDVYAGGPPAVIRLEPAAVIDLTFVDPTGAPAMPNNLRFFRDMTSGGRHSWTVDLTVLPEPGRLRLYLPPTESWVEVVSGRHENVELGPFLPGRVPSEMTVELTPYPRVPVVVSAGGVRVPEARVTVHQLFPETWSQESNGFPVLIDDPLGSAVTDEDGVAVASLDLEEVDGDAPLEFVIRVSADGWPALLSRTFTLRELRREDPIETVLEVGGVIEGEMVLPDGENPAGRYVAASCGDGEIRTANLGRDGRYRFEDLTPGPWLVRETFPALLRGSTGSGQHAKPGETTQWSCEVRAGETTRFDLNLRDEPGFTLRGSVRVVGAAVGAWPCQLTPPGRTDAILDQYYKWRRLDPSGQFEFRAPRLGSHRLVIHGTIPAEVASEGDSESEVPTSSISIRDTVELVPGEQEWSAELTLAELRVRFDHDVEGTLTYTQADGSRVITARLVEVTSGVFVGRVPAPGGELSWRADGTTRVLQRVELDPATITEIDLKP